MEVNSYERARQSRKAESENKAEFFVCFVLFMWWAGNCSITESLPELIQEVRQDRVSNIAV